MNARKQYLFILGISLLTSLALLWITSRVWVSTAPSEANQLDQQLEIPVEISGSQVVPIVFAAALVNLTSTLALLATATWGRRIVGVVALGFAVAGLIDLRNVSPSESSAFWVLTPILLLILVGSNSIVIVRSHRWPSMGRRYDRSAQLAAADPWTVLDHGEDPSLIRDFEGRSDNDSRSGPSSQSGSKGAGTESRHD